MALEFTSTGFAKSDETDGSTAPGMGTIWLAKADDFTDIATRFASPTSDEEEVSVDGDHTFPVGKGFAPFYHDQQDTDTSLDAAMNGSGDSSNTLTTLTLFYPGKNKKIEAMLKKKPEVIGLVGDIDCARTEFVQVGDKCNKAYIKEWSWTKGNKMEATKSGYTIVIEAITSSILNYSGALTKAS